MRAARLRARAPAIEDGTLVLTRGARRLELALRDIAAVEPWRCRFPARAPRCGWPRASAGGTASRWPIPPALAGRWQAAGGAPLQEGPPSRATAYRAGRAWRCRRGRLDHPLAKFVLLPLVLAIPAFRLHQHIAYGSAFGEYYTFGLVAYLKGFALWWAAWAIGVVLCAAVLRAIIEAGTIGAVLLHPAWSIRVRRWLESDGLAALYLGVPVWLLIRVVAP